MIHIIIKFIIIAIIAFIISFGYIFISYSGSKNKTQLINIIQESLITTGIMFIILDALACWIWYIII